MTQIQINGVRFETATEWVANNVYIWFSDTLGGVDNGTYVRAFDPDSPQGVNNGINGITVNAWTDTLIDFDFPGHEDEFVTHVTLYNDSNTAFDEFEITPDQPVTPAAEPINVSYDANTDELIIYADNPIFPVVGSEQYWLDIVGTSTNAAVGATRISDNELRFSDAFPSLGGPTTVTSITIGRSEAYPDRVTVAVWNGSVSLSQTTLVTAGIGYTDPNLIITGNNCDDQLAANFDSLVAGVITGDDSAMAGFEVTFADSSTVIYDGDNSVFSNPAPSLWLASTPDVHRKQATEVVAVDINGDPIAAGVSPLPDGYGCTLEIDTFTIDENSVSITFLPPLVGTAASAFNPDPDTRLFIKGCTENGGAGFNVAFDNPTGPQAGDNDPAWVFNQWDENGIEIDTSASPTAIVSADIDIIDLQVIAIGSIAVEKVGVPPAYPLLESVCSPAADTVRFEGQQFLTGSAPIGYVVVRLADYSTGPELSGASMIVDLSAPGDWTVVTFTDNIIELSNPNFTAVEPSAGPGDFVVTGAAFHDAIDQSYYYYYEPWGETFSTPVDGAGCGDLTITSVVQSGFDEITITGTNFLTAAVDRFEVTGSFGTFTFCVQSSPNFPGCLPPGAGVGALSETSLAVSAAGLVGATVESIVAEDLTATYSVFFDIVPDITM